MLLKPPKGARLNYGHPLAQGLSALYVFDESVGTTRDLTGRQPSAVFSTGTVPATWDLSLGGQAGRIENSVHAAGYITATGCRQLPIAADDAFSLEVVVYMTVAVLLAGVAAFGAPYETPASGQRRALLVYAGGSNDDIYFYGGGADLDSGVRWRTDGQKQHVIVTRQYASSTVTFYRDGLQIASGALGGSLTTAPSQVIILGDRYLGSASGSGNSMRVTKAAIYNRALSPQEIMQLALDPFAMVRYDPLPRVMQAPATGVTYPQLERWVRGLNRGVYEGAYR